MLNRVILIDEKLIIKITVGGALEFIMTSTHVAIYSAQYA